MTNKVIQYKSAHDDYAKWYSGNSNLVYRFRPNICGMYYVTGKDAYLCDKNNHYTPFSTIVGNAWWNTSANRNNKLFISPDCKIPRDLVRNSGYKVVMNKDNADYVVVPTPKDTQCSSYSFNVAFTLKDNEDAYFIRVNRHDGIETFTDEEIEIILERIKQEVADYGYEVDEFFYNNDLSKFKVYFVPKCEEYRDIFERKYKYQYALDTNVELVGATNMSIETLEIWSHMDSEQVLQKSVMNSDWQKYPCTLAVFLREERNAYCYRPTGQWAWLLNQIHYNIFENDIEYADVITTPEDWNMLQKWVMHKLDVSDSGGYVRWKDYDNLPWSYKKVITQRMYVKPVNITEEANFNNLISRAKDI